MRNTKLNETIHEVPADHEFINVAFDPNYFDVDHYFSMNQGPNSFKRRCIYGRDISEYIFDYGESFLKAY
jgi:hypothetical protein